MRATSSPRGKSPMVRPDRCAVTLTINSILLAVVIAAWPAASAAETEFERERERESAVSVKPSIPGNVPGRAISLTRSATVNFADLARQEALQRLRKPAPPIRA